MEKLILNQPDIGGNIPIQTGRLEYNLKIVFSREEVCQILGISLRTEQTWRDQKRISFSQLGRKIFYQRADLNDFLDKHHIKACYGSKGGAI